MARWEPDARGRLEKAAMDLFQVRGYAHTTVGDIAAGADLTERTFFRYFADKREVLFSGAKELEQGIVERIANAPKNMPPLDAVVAALEAAGTHLEQRRDLEYVRARYVLVAKHPEIQERELIKLASLAAATTQALLARGVSEPEASLAAEAGIAVFKIGFERWVKERVPHDLAGHIRAALALLRTVTAGTANPKPQARKKKKRVLRA
jgi:AcrR family transcriptional regulator